MKVHSYKYAIRDQDLLNRIDVLNSLLDENIGLRERIDSMQHFIVNMAPHWLEELQRKRDEKECNGQRHLHVLHHYDESVTHHMGMGAGMQLCCCDVCQSISLRPVLVIGG